eukprot:765123-Hanusia_phi.AAC.4
MNEENCMSFLRIEIQVLQYSSMRQELSPAKKAISLVRQRRLEAKAELLQQLLNNESFKKELQAARILDSDSLIAFSAASFTTRSVTESSSRGPDSFLQAVTAISQRDADVFYFELQSNKLLQSVKSSDQVHPRMRALAFEDYIFDVFVPPDEGRCILMEIYPFTATSDAALYDWDNAESPGRAKSAAPAARTAGRGRFGDSRRETALEPELPALEWLDDSKDVTVAQERASCKTISGPFRRSGEDQGMHSVVIEGERGPVCDCERFLALISVQEALGCIQILNLLDMIAKSQSEKCWNAVAAEELFFFPALLATLAGPLNSSERKAFCERAVQHCKAAFPHCTAPDSTRSQNWIAATRQTSSSPLRANFGVVSLTPFFVKLLLFSSLCFSIPLHSSPLHSSPLLSSRLVSSRLVSSRLVSSRLVSSRLVSSRLVSSRLVSSRLVSFPLLYLFSSPCFSSSATLSSLPAEVSTTDLNIERYCRREVDSRDSRRVRSRLCLFARKELVALRKLDEKRS